MKISRALVAVAALSTTLVGGEVAWAASTHANGKASAPTQTVTVTVKANNPDWTDTGVALTAHQTLKITAKGTVSNGIFSVDPGGKPLPNWSCTHFQGYPMPSHQLGCWSLIGKIGDGQPFQANRVNVTDVTPGELFLRMNDAPVSDNSGSWTATITTAP
jgi:hypothetical protein